MDLDGTLIRTNSLDETFFDTLRRDPFSIWKVPLQLAFGRAKLKEFLASKSRLEVDTWPVRGDLLEYVKQQFELGRRIVLATAADKKIAEAIAAHYPFISEVIASDGTLNLKEDAKAKCLRERFPEGFIYAGDSSSDIAVGREAKGSILVGASNHVTKRVQRFGAPVAVFSSRRRS
jgi:phosphoserine phosphatase